MRVWFWKWWWYVLLMACILSCSGYHACGQIMNPPQSNPDGCNSGMKAGDYPPGF